MKNTKETKTKSPSTYQLLAKKCIMTKKRRVKRSLTVTYIILASVMLSAAVIGFCGQLTLKASESTPDVNVPHKNKVIIKGQPAIKVYSPEEAKTKVLEIAKKRDFKWPEYLLKLAKCESRFYQFNNNVNKDKTIDRGIFQINDYWHPGVSNEKAYDLEWATNWTIDKINAGQQHLWACDRIIKAGQVKLWLPSKSLYTSS